MHATFAADGRTPTGDAHFRASFPPVEAAPVAPAAIPVERSAYGERQGPNWTAIGTILAVHAALLFALVSLDVIDIMPPKPAPLVVDLVNLAPPPPPPPAAAPDPEVAQVKPPEPVVVAPPPVVQLAAPPPPAIATVAAPPPPQAAIVAPAPARPAFGATPVSVDLSANLLIAKPPRYPTECRRKREEGIVLLRLLLGTDGAVSDIAVARSSGFERLDKAALEAVRRWRWSPTMQAGQAVQVRGVVEIPFQLQG